MTLCERLTGFPAKALPSQVASGVQAWLCSVRGVLPIRGEAERSVFCQNYLSLLRVDSCLLAGTGDVVTHV